jgi:hypothetical protein
LGFVWSNTGYTAATDVQNNIFRSYQPTPGTAGGTVSNNIGGDPRVEDPLSYDFRPRAGSPAIDAGTEIPGITDGYAGDAPDIGPYETGQNWRAGATFFTASENVARNAVVTASSCCWAPENTAAAVTDGDPTSRWNAARGQIANQWLQFDFGSPVPVNRVRVSEMFTRISSWALQQWNGSAWVDVTTGSALGTQTLTFPAVTTSRIRLLMSSTSETPTITEMAVYRTERITNPLLNVTAKGVTRRASEKLGQKFTTKGSPIEVTELGRYVLPGNSRSHALELVRVVDGSTVASATLDLATARPRPDGFAYTRLVAPVVLAPYTSYYLVTTETASGDTFHDTVGARATAGDLITLDGAVYRTDRWNELRNNGGYGPVTLTYQPFRAKDARPVLTVTSTGASRNDYTGKHGARITPARALTISQLGRRKGTGTGVHSLSIVRVSDGVQIAVARLDLSAPTAPAEDGIVYTPLSQPVTLAANTPYYLVSTETSGGDQFFDVWGTSATSDRATVNSGVYWNGSGWSTPASTGALYGPVNLR